VEAKPRVASSPHKPSLMKADVSEGDSPKALPTEPTDKITEEALPESGLQAKSNQSEDKDGDSEERERDIYSDAVLECKPLSNPELISWPLLTHFLGSIENPESCVMCSG
jgi:ribonucleoside-diphosphate reductase subunit M1